MASNRAPRLSYEVGAPGLSEPQRLDRTVSLQEPLLSVAQTAELLNVQASTIYYLVNIGELPHRRVGRRIRFYRPDLEDYLEAQRPAAVSRHRPWE